MTDLREKYTPMKKTLVTTETVEKLLLNLNTTKASGLDRIAPRVLKELSKEIALIMTIIYQQFLNMDNVPVDWRQALILPSYQKWEHCDLVNYHPVSLTSMPCKVFEHIIISHH